MASTRGSVSSQQYVTGGVTIEGDAIRSLSLRQLEETLDREFKYLKKEMMKEIRKQRSKK